MNNPFVTTETKVNKTINYVENGRLGNGASISVAPSGSKEIKLVIGAEYEDRSACYFGKASLLKLAETLKEIAEAL